MHACLTAAVINHCLEDYWRNVLVWAHSPVYLTGCSELQCKMNWHRCASSTASQHRLKAILSQESIFWLMAGLRCALGYLLSRVCSSDLHRMWSLLEFESVVHSHYEKLFTLVQNMLLAVQSSGSKPLLLQISGPATRGATGRTWSFWCCWKTIWWHLLYIHNTFSLLVSLWIVFLTDSKSKDLIH